MVITRKIKNMLEAGIDPLSIAAITFTKKAAAEMRDRLFNAVGAPAYQVVVCNWHSFALNIVLRPAEKLKHPYLAHQKYSLDSELIVLSDSESYTLLNEAAKTAIPDADFDEWKSAGGVKALARRIGLAKAYGRSVKDEYQHQTAIFQRSLADHKEQQRFYNDILAWRAYEYSLRNLNAIDYDNILLLAVELLKADPSFLKKIQQRFAYVLADEHQDVNPIQGELLKLIVGDGRGLTMVGDEKQSIYMFRAADVKQLLNAQDDYSNMQVVNMADNFRSTNEVVALANVIAARMTERITDGQMIPMRKASGALPSYQFFNSDIDEAEYVVNQIQQDLQSGIEAKEIAVLYRSKSLVLKASIEKKLIERGLEYQVVGDQGFFDRADVKDWLAFLRFCVNGNDVMAASRVLEGAGVVSSGLTMRRAVTDEGIKVLDFFKQKSLAKGNAASTIKRTEGYKTLIHHQAELHSLIEEMGSKKGIQQIIDESGSDEDPDVVWQQVKALFQAEMLNRWKEIFRPALEERKTKELMKKQSGEPIAEMLAEKMAESETAVNSLIEKTLRNLGDEGSVREAIRDISMLVDSGDALENSINLMTLHASKGLEMKSVYLVGVEDETHFKPNTEEEVHEELRLLYVGVTRAEDKLSITGAAKRWLYNGLQNRKPLRFLEGIDTTVMASNLRTGGASTESSTVQQGVMPVRPIRFDLKTTYQGERPLDAYQRQPEQEGGTEKAPAKAKRIGGFLI